MKKYIAELFGTFVLVFLGSGTFAVLGNSSIPGSGYYINALVPGLILISMAYCIGNVSGCHLNPAVSLGVLLAGGMNLFDFIFYVISQCFGAFLGIGLSKGIIEMSNVNVSNTTYGLNTLTAIQNNTGAGLILVMILTFIFVLVFLENIRWRGGNGYLSGIVVGLTFTLLYLFEMKFTQGSLNPAKSLAINIAIAPSDLSALWVFLLGPFLGAALAAGIHKLFAFEKI